MDQPASNPPEVPPVQILTADGVKTAPQYDLRYFFPGLMDTALKCAFSMTPQGEGGDWIALKESMKKLSIDPDQVVHALAVYVRAVEIMSAAPPGSNPDSLKALTVAGYDALDDKAHIPAFAIIGRSVMAMALYASRSDVTGRVYGGMAKEVLSVKRKTEELIGKQNAGHP